MLRDLEGGEGMGGKGQETQCTQTWLKKANLEDAPKLSAVKMHDLGSMHQGR
jgi:hypothetical protein